MKKECRTRNNQLAGYSLNYFSSIDEWSFQDAIDRQLIDIQVLITAPEWRGDLPVEQAGKEEQDERIESRPRWPGKDGSARMNELFLHC
jgi:hypothetical protein